MKIATLNTSGVNKQGFTLIEMLVAMGILFIMTGISMANYNRFGQQTELENATYELALNIRQAQFFGINRSERFGETFDEPQPHGVYFNLDGTEQGADNQSFIVFVDDDSSSSAGYQLFDTTDDSFDNVEICQSNFSNECVNVLSFNRNNYISDICVGNNETDCESLSLAQDRELHISFKRPDPDATIYGFSDTHGQGPHSFAQISVRSQVSDITTQTVSIGAAGLISIN